MDGSLDGFGGYVSLYAVLGCVRSFPVVLSRFEFVLSSMTFSKFRLFQIVSGCFRFLLFQLIELHFCVACF